MHIVTIATKMSRAMKEMAPGEFKARCLAVMDEVQQNGEPVFITKRGQPFAKLVAARKKGDDIFGYMSEKAKIVGDIIRSMPSELWTILLRRHVPSYMPFDTRKLSK